MEKKQTNKIRLITGTAMLTAVAVGLQYVEIAIPIMPSFIKLDFSDLPELIGAFAYGPLAGVIIALLKNLIHMAVSQSGFVGELSNFLLGASFALVAGLIYKHKKTKGEALVAGIAASLVMAVISVPFNYFIIYPLYYNVLGFPEAAVLQMYQVILPKTKSILQALLIFNHAPGQGHCFVRVGSNSGAGTLFYPHLTMISRHQQYSTPKMNNIPHPRQSSKKTKGAIKNETPIPRNPNSPPVPLLTSRDRIPPLSPRQVHFHPSATNRNTSTALSHKSQQ